jgi:hypothetical protein
MMEISEKAFEDTIEATLLAGGAVQKEGRSVHYPP